MDAIEAHHVGQSSGICAVLPTFSTVAPATKCPRTGTSQRAPILGGGEGGVGGGGGSNATLQTELVMPEEETGPKTLLEYNLQDWPSTTKPLHSVLSGGSGGGFGGGGGDGGLLEIE